MRGDPADLALRNLQRLVERDPILRDIVNPNLPTARRGARFVPPVDVIERPDAYVVVLELAGVPKESVKVHLDGSRLTVSGDKPGKRDGATRVAERETGPFSREFLVPFQVRADAITARMADGLLTIELPRSGRIALATCRSPERPGIAEPVNVDRPGWPMREGDVARKLRASKQASKQVD